MSAPCMARLIATSAAKTVTSPALSTKLRHIRVHLTHSWPEEIRLRDVDVVRDDEQLQEVPSAGIRNLACGPAQRHLPRDIHEQRAKLQTASDGRLFPLSRHALRWLDPRPGSASEHEGPLASGSRRTSPISPQSPARAAIGCIVPAAFSKSPQIAFQLLVARSMEHWHSSIAASACTSPRLRFKFRNCKMARAW